MKTEGEAMRKVKAVDAGHGVEAYRKLSSWYNAISASTLHELRINVMRPEPAQKAEQVAERIEEWRTTLIRLQHLDKTWADDR